MDRRDLSGLLDWLDRRDLSDLCKRSIFPALIT